MLKFKIFDVLYIQHIKYLIYLSCQTLASVYIKICTNLTRQMQIYEFNSI